MIINKLEIRINNKLIDQMEYFWQSLHTIIIKLTILVYGLKKLTRSI